MRRPSFWALREVATWRPWTMSPREEGLMMSNSVMNLLLTARALGFMAFQDENQTPNPVLVTTFALEVLGRLLAVLPEFLLNGLSQALGALIRWVSPGRRRLVASNLDHAFPDKSRAWKESVG